MWLLPWHLAVAYVLDLLIGDPRWLPHPIRWIGRWIKFIEWVFYDGGASAALQRTTGCIFCALVVAGVLIASRVLVGISLQLDFVFGQAVIIWLAYTTLATGSLHRESSRVVEALRHGDLTLARERLSMIVSRDTAQLKEREVLRALIETVAENISDGIVAPLMYLSVGGVLGAVAYKALNTMDSMVGYQNERYRSFGTCAARADDVANWIPARLSGVILVGVSACLKLDWRAAWRVMRRDAGKMKSPNAGYPEAAAAGALGVQLGGANLYFGQLVQKSTLGDAGKPITIETYGLMIRLLYLSSIVAFLVAIGIRYGIARSW
jgi:adenosylcobinamide-phosphate synthase